MYSYYPNAYFNAVIRCFCSALLQLSFCNILIDFVYFLESSCQIYCILLNFGRGYIQSVDSLTIQKFYHLYIWKQTKKTPSIFIMMNIEKQND